MLRLFIKSQQWLSWNFDKLLPQKFRVDGNQDFIKSLVPKYMMENMTVFDIGSGKNPYLTCAKKKTLNARVIGLDIDNEELVQAPEHAYDEIICADIGIFRGHHNADIVICQALLEHVNDVEAAFQAIASILKPGGLALIFVPSRNALFARLNLLLPQNIKKAILYSFYPLKKRNQGFPAYYDRCTPSEFKKLAISNDLFLAEERLYYVSSYFSCFFPLYLVWRIWVMLFYLLDKEQAAETFCLVFKKEEHKKHSNPY